MRDKKISMSLINSKGKVEIKKEFKNVKEMSKWLKKNNIKGQDK